MWKLTVKNINHANGRFMYLKIWLFSAVLYQNLCLLNLILELLSSPRSLVIPTALAFLQADPSLAEGVDGYRLTPKFCSTAALLSCVHLTHSSSATQDIENVALVSPSQRAWKWSTKLPSHERINTFSQKYLACRCLAVWWIALIFYRKQILFLWKKYAHKIQLFL